MLKFSFIFFLLVFLNISTKAALGCIGSSSGNYYISGGGPTNFPYGTLGANGIAPATFLSTYCVTNTEASGTCFITGTPLGTVSGSRITYFSIGTCPIDDYIPFFLVAIGGLGFFYLRRKKEIFVIR